MELMIDPDSHIKWLSDRVDEQPTSVIITSFGLYAGISYAGQDMTEIGWKFRSRTRDLMEKMRSLPNVKFLIGTSRYKSCKGRTQCLDCEKQYSKEIIRLSHHVQFFPEFKWKAASDIHMKACIFIYGDRCKGISGGRNFTDSDWFDCTFELTEPNIKTLLKHITPIWNSSKFLDDSAMESILEEQGISKEGFDLVLGEKQVTKLVEEAPF